MSWELRLTAGREAHRNSRFRQDLLAPQARLSPRLRFWVRISHLRPAVRYHADSKGSTPALSMYNSHRARVDRCTNLWDLADKYRSCTAMGSGRGSCEV